MTGLDAFGREPCAHTEAVPVTLTTGETVAALCPSCDQQLPAEAVGCEHEVGCEITALGHRWPSYMCSKCHAVYGRQSTMRDPRDQANDPGARTITKGST